MIGIMFPYGSFLPNKAGKTQIGTFRRKTVVL